jgi:4-amino-4-deoxy-L-arabinose transferase-like glycosyltransferase
LKTGGRIQDRWNPACLIKRSHLLPILFGSGVTLWLRLANLGYSDLQGDEIKALALVKPGQTLLNFIFEQRKGPVQFFITYLVGLLQAGYENNFLNRLPFAIASILAVYFFYQVVQIHFGKKIGLYAALFFCLNGVFIGLSRIVQYQSLVLLFSILALYFFSLAGQRERMRLRGLYLGAICWGLAILTHYDGIFIAPFVIYLLFKWYQTQPDLDAPEKRRHILLALVLMAILVGVFFIPFALDVSHDTQSYWLERFTGEGAADLIPSSLITFSLYNPSILIYIYLVLLLASLARGKSLLPVILWALLPWGILELLVFDPGTHIYNYLLPACILWASGLQILEDFAGRFVRGKAGQIIKTGLVTGLFLFLFSIAHLIFIDHTPEYPWTERGFLGWVIGLPDERYRLWVYGFPYNRQWDEIGDFIAQDQLSTYYSTNENKSIASYFVPLAFDIDRAGYYIHVYHPQSFHEHIASEKIRYWMKNHPPVKVLADGGQTRAEIYLMPAGSLEAIRQAGY